MKPCRDICEHFPLSAARAKTCKEIAKNFTRHSRYVKKSQNSLHDNKTQQQVLNIAMNYGLPYMGSKSKIVKDIEPLFPNADNFVDLFAGGGAVTHYAMTTAKYKHFVFNDINPLMPKAFGMALNGEFENEKRWISREEFFRLRDTDPYVAICFSFGNNLSDYMYSKDIEPIKEAYHYALFFGDYSLAKERMGIDFTPLEKCPTIKEKYAALKDIVKILPPPLSVETRLQSMERQERIWRAWNAAQGAVESPKYGSTATAHFTTPPTPRGRKCRARNPIV